MVGQDLYTDPAAMEPLLPTDANGELEGLAVDLIAKAARLSGSMHPVTRGAIAGLVRPMNSYYSNLIEGHDTHPIAIERAMRKELVKDRQQRDLQLEAVAHINVSKALALGTLPGLEDADPSSAAFLKGVHRAFYDHLPESFRSVKSEEGEERTVVPGEWRAHEVKVGRHIAPAHRSLPAFIERFASFHDRKAPINRQLPHRIIALAAAHHRLAWIHPFLDGNGRVVRLHSDAWLRREGLDADGLWSISRGLARHRDKYMSLLANADLPRRNSYDGRGNLSNTELVAFCRFFLQTAIDQVEFMHTSLDPDRMLARLEAFTDRMVQKKRLRAGARHVLGEVFLRGRLAKPDAERIMGLSDKPAKKVTDELIALGLLSVRKEGIVMVYSANYPLLISPWILPSLYPESKEVEIMADT